MPEYLVLLAPSSNRVYAGDAPQITAAEAAIVVRSRWPDGFRGAAATSVAGVPYVGVDLADSVDPAVLGTLAAAHAVFAREGPLLRPVPAATGRGLDEDLLSIPKYPGKTNEQLTRVLLNLTAAAATTTKPGPLTVLDPLAGRGTTLSWALTLGYDAVGVEIDRREVEAYAAYLRTWLRRKRLSHRVDLRPLRRDSAVLAQVLSAEVRPAKDSAPRTLTMYAADTLATAALLQRRRVDLVVTDAPYGVVHGSRTAGQPGVSHRSPADLLSAAVPVWTSVLRPGGAVGIAWNTHGLSRGDLSATCAAAGLEVCQEEPHLGLAHRVDAGIRRDLLVARKPR